MLKITTTCLTPLVFPLPPPNHRLATTPSHPPIANPPPLFIIKPTATTTHRSSHPSFPTHQLPKPPPPSPEPKPMPATPTIQPVGAGVAFPAPSKTRSHGQPRSQPLFPLENPLVPSPSPLENPIPAPPRPPFPFLAATKEFPATQNHPKRNPTTRLGWFRAGK